MLNSRFARFAAAVALPLSLAAVTPAFAATGMRQAVVYHGDLDLTRAPDKAELQKRLKTAAGKVCRNVSELRMRSLCREETLSNTEQPYARAIARAELKDRYAQASEPAKGIVVGN